MIRMIRLPLFLLPLLLVSGGTTLRAQNANGRGQGDLSLSDPTGVTTLEDLWSPAPPADEPIRRYKRGLLQRAAVSGSWLGPSDDDSLGMRQVEATVQMSVPLGSMEHIVAITPSFRIDMLDAPTGLDVPDNLYTTGASIFWKRPLNDRWGVNLLASPTVRSDFDATENSVRVFGMAMLTWDWVPDKLLVSMGAVYLDRNDISLLPAVGFRWTPGPRWRFDLRFPQPKISYRIAKDGCHSEKWAYVVGALGGNTWAVRRSDGRSDELTIRDYRVMVGLEHIVEGGGGLFGEVGVAFGRELEYESDKVEVPFDSAFVVRAGIAY